MMIGLLLTLTLAGNATSASSSSVTYQSLTPLVSMLAQQLRERLLDRQPNELESRRKAALEHLVRGQRRIEEAIELFERCANSATVPEIKKHFRDGQVELRKNLEELRIAERQLRKEPLQETPPGQ